MILHFHFRFTISYKLEIAAAVSLRASFAIEHAVLRGSRIAPHTMYPRKLGGVAMLPKLATRYVTRHPLLLRRAMQELPRNVLLTPYRQFSLSTIINATRKDEEEEAILIATRRPTFTAEPDSLKTPLAHRSQDPLSPTKLDANDYAPPMVSFRATFDKGFRYAVFTSVAIVITAVGGWFSFMLWIEKVGLKGTLEKDSEGWSEEVEGWSGGYLGGGTDPRLSFLTRIAIRSAWLSCTYGSGPMNQTITSKYTSPFAPGGAVIGQAEAAAMSAQVVDAGWARCEAYLVNALNRMDSNGISLTTPITNKDGSKSSIDPAAFELECRLAGIRERIGGKAKLEQAREGWERLYEALLDNTHGHQDWQRRAKMRVCKKLGDISGRLGDCWTLGSPERNTEKRKAEGWYLRGLLPALLEQQRPLLQPSKKEDRKVASPSSSFFAFWSHSHPPTNAINDSVLAPSLPNSGHLVGLLEQSSSSEAVKIHSADSRAIISLLVGLETLLARNRDLEAARVVQSASLSYVRSMMNVAQNKTQSATLGRPDLTDRVATGKWLSQLNLASRCSILSTHLSEVNLVLGGSEAEALALLQGAINDCQSISDALYGTFLTKEKSSSWLQDLNWENKNTKVQRLLFEKAAKDAVRDARLTGAMSSVLTAFVHERGCGSLAQLKKSPSKKVLEWCGGDATAEVFYGRAMEFAGSNSKSQSRKNPDKILDEKTYREAQRGYERTKRSILVNSRA